MMTLLQTDYLRWLWQPLTSGSYPWWVVTVELLLIGLPVYLVLRFLRGTRGERLVWAVGLILVIPPLFERQWLVGCLMLPVLMKIWYIY